MASKKEHLARLVKLQHRLKALHETRQALHLKNAAAADEEAADIIRKFETPDSLSALFPEIYHERIGRALIRKEENLSAASREADEKAKANTKGRVAERILRDASRKEEREQEEKTVLEMLEQWREPNDS